MDELREIVEKTNLMAGSRCENVIEKPRRRKIRRLANTDYDDASDGRIQRILLFCIVIPTILSCLAIYFNASHSNYFQMIVKEFSNNYRRHYNHILYGNDSYCYRHQPLNMENLFMTVKQQYQIIHQDEALKHLKVALRNNSDINTISFIGPVGVGKSLIVNALAEHFPWPKNVHSYSWSTVVKHEVQKFHIIRLIINNMSKCGRNLIIIENLETCDHGIVPIVNDLIQKTDKSVLIIYIFSLNTDLNKDILDEQRFFLKLNLAETNIINFNTFTKNIVKDCIKREAGIEGVTLMPQDINEIIDTSNPYRFGCKNINAKVRLYGTIKNIV